MALFNLCSISKCYSNCYNLLSVNKDLLASLSFVNIHLLCTLNPALLHCNKWWYSVIHWLCDIIDMWNVCNNAYPNVAYPNVAYPNVAYPNVAHPNVAHPNVAYPNVAYPNVVYPNVVYPNVAKWCDILKYCPALIHTIVGYFWERL